jgi:hypothetical protein
MTPAKSVTVFHDSVKIRLRSRKHIKMNELL